MYSIGLILISSEVGFLLSNVNATVCCYSDVLKQGGLLAFVQPLTGVSLHSGEHGKLFSKSFVVVTQLNLLGNVIEDFEVLVRLTRWGTDPDEPLCVDLDTFTVDSASVEVTELPFVNYIRVTKVDNLEVIGGAGYYVVKVLVRKAGSEKWVVQSLNHLRFISSVE